MNFKDYLEMNEGNDIANIEKSLVFMGKDGLEPTVEEVGKNTYKITNSDKWGGQKALKDAFTGDSKFAKALVSVDVQKDHIVVEFSDALMKHLKKG